MQIRMESIVLASLILGAQGLAQQTVDSTTEQTTISGRRAPAADRFLAVAAARLGAPQASIELSRIEGPVRMNDLGVEVFLASAAIGDGEKIVVALNAEGVAVDFSSLRTADRELGLARRGKMALRLQQELERAPDLRERHTIVVWIDAPSVEDVRADHAYLTSELDRANLLTKELADQHQGELTERIKGRIQPRTSGFAERMKAAGFEVVGNDEYVPIVFVRANASELARLADDAEVASLDWAGMEYVERLNVATGEVRANFVWPQVSGLGVGAKVAVVESTRVCSTNPWMPVTATRLPAGAVGAHTTGVASCIKSSHPTYPGVARGCTLLSANGADFTNNTTNVSLQMPGSVAAVSWAVGQGAHILNLSYGAVTPGATVSSFDKYLDYVARNNAKTIAIACGNSGGFAGDPGAGFNQLAVGTFADAGTTSWLGETMAGFSSWQNPTTGVETPQVAAPGVGIDMLTCAAPWTGYNSSGTSFSSPLVAGTAALLVGRQPALGSWPEAIRAITMATAWHNIEGAGTLSSRDGAGGIDAKAAFAVATRGFGPGYAYGTLTPASFDALGFVRTQVAAANAGEAVRVALSFDSTVSAGPTYGTDNLMCDLDLYVYSPTGALVATSLSAIQPFEVVRFTAPVTGNYTVKVKRFSFSGTSEFYGTAFTRSIDI